ncbi:MAG: response regulator, partial [Cyanobacteria bacterium J06639_1]
MSVNASASPEPSILIVDDEIDSLNVLATALSDRGYKVRKAISGAMALTGVRAAPPSLIVLDIKMPEMNGFEVCKQLKSNPITQRIPIIFLSVLDEPIDKVKAFSLGGADYIAKPFQIEEAIARVEHQLTIQSLYQQLANQNRDLKQANDQLRLEIAERKKMEVERDRLLKSERAANLAKDEFVSTVSHELRSPLANMQMAIRMLLLGAEGEKRERYLTILHEECKRET